MKNLKERVEERREILDIMKRIDKAPNSFKPLLFGKLIEKIRGYDGPVIPSLYTITEKYRKTL